MIIHKLLKNNYWGGSRNQLLTCPSLPLTREVGFAEQNPEGEIKPRYNTEAGLLCGDC